MTKQGIKKTKQELDNDLFILVLKDIGTILTQKCFLRNTVKTIVFFTLRYNHISV